MPNQERVARQDFEQGPRVSGAVFFDIDDVAAVAAENPKQLPVTYTHLTRATKKLVYVAAVVAS